MASQGYNIPFLGVTSGKVFVAGERDVENRLVRDMLESFGEIYSFEVVERENRKLVVCEYFDRRRVTDLIESMNGRDMFVSYDMTPAYSRALFSQYGVNLLLRFRGICGAILFLVKW